MLVTALRPYSVLPDANIWVSATLHSWFALIANETTRAWTFHWTEDIMAEAVKGRRRRFPKSSSKQMEDLRARLLDIFGENKITSFPHDGSVTYSDDFDAHVHSAAVHAGIAMVVTDNIKDFENLYADPDECPYDLFTADQWLMVVAKSEPSAVDKAILQQHSYWSQYGKHNLPRKLEDAGCADFAAYVRMRLQIIL